MATPVTIPDLSTPPQPTHVPVHGRRSSAPVVRVAVAAGLITLTLVGLIAKMIDHPTVQLNLPLGQVSYRLPPLLALGLILAIGVASFDTVRRAATARSDSPRDR